MKKVFCALLMVLSLSVLAEADCRKVGVVCTAPNQTRNIDGMSVFRECWEYQDSYQCKSQNMTNDCQSLRDRGCGQVGSRCMSSTTSGACTTWEQSFQCVDKAESWTEKTVCDTSSFCQSGGGCFDTSSKPDADFAKGAVMMEAAREAGVYGIDPNKVEIFKGYADTCSIKVLGGTTIKSCCKSAGGGGAFTNYAVLGGAMAVGGEGARESVAAGSKYVYDTLYGTTDSALVDKGLKAMNDWASGLGDGTFNPTMSMYGFSFEFTFANGFEFTGFDPYSFAASVAIKMISEWLQCSQSEQMMGMKKGQNLCVQVDAYCSSKVLGICVERKEVHCCFNSKLAKIINRQGRAQLGLPMSQCGGFTQSQVTQLDFSRMDLSEFIADITPKDVSAGTLSNKVNQTVQQRVTNYYSQ